MNTDQIVAEINSLKGCIVPRQKGRRIQYAFGHAGHPKVAPNGFIHVHIGVKRRNVLSLTPASALEFITQVRRYAGEA